ncbi:MAG: hypothetical protein KF824_03210 [Fimbriimonadaceae bacterium]|nr:MAG: hypothetical protein KF824_03210 [Fimbriimonadaceae bacterium]
MSDFGTDGYDDTEPGFKSMERKDPLTLHQERLNSLDRRQWLHPMTSGEIMEGAARFYQISARHILPRTALPTALCYIALTFILTFLLPNFYVVTGGQELANDAVKMVVATLITLFVAIPLFVYGLGLSSVVAIQQVSPFITGDNLNYYESNKGESKNVWQFTFFLSLIGAESLLPVIISAAMFLFGAALQASAPESILPGLLAVIGSIMAFLAFFITPYLILRNLLGPVVFTLEQHTIKSAYKRGKYLSKAHNQVSSSVEVGIYLVLISLFIVLGLYFGVSMITSLILGSGPVQSFVGSVIWGDLIVSAISMIPGYIVLWLVLPFWASAATLSYYDRRIRLEAFDIRTLAQDVLEVRTDA